MATYSALPATLNLVATVGNDFTLSLTVTESGSPWVATGATLATDIIDSSGTVVATDFATAASTGTVSLSLTDANTTTLGVGVYSYRLSVTKSSVTRDWIAGTLSIVEAGVGGASTSSASLAISNSAVSLSLTSLVAPLAENISVADAGGYYTGDTVEAVLAELPTIYLKPRGNTCIIIGDSIAIGGDISEQLYGQSVFARMCAVSGQRLQFFRNAGVSGNTSTQMLARIATDVVAYAPQWCLIAAVSPNDVSGAIAVATRKSNITAMVAACRAANIGVILATSCPSDTTATRDSLLSMNAWLAGYAQANGIPLIDWYTPVADTADSTWNSTYTSDGTHPNAAGQDAIAVAAAATLSDFVTRPTTFMHTVGISDASNLITNGVFVGDTNVDGIANNWSKVGSGITSQQLVAMTAAEGVGNWQELTSNGSLGYIEQTVSTGFSVGDVIEFSGKWYSATAANIVNYSQLVFNGPGTNVRYYLPTNTSAARAWSLRATIPAATTSIAVRAVLNATATTLRVGQMTLRNLTTLGV